MVWCTNTGLSGWGIAFYIDGILAPVLRLRRNVTYTFIVEAGNNATDPPNYHPFYITNSQDGGILLNQRMVGSHHSLCRCNNAHTLDLCYYSNQDFVSSNLNVIVINIILFVTQNNNEVVYAGFNVTTNTATAGKQLASWL